MSAEEDDDGDKPQLQQEEDDPSQTANGTDDSDATLDEKQIEETHVGGGEASQEAATDVEVAAAGDHSAPVVPSIKSSPLTSARDKPDSAAGIGRSNENRNKAANGSSRTGSPPNSYRGALVAADRENGDDPSDNADIAAVVREAIDNYQSILTEYPSDTRTAGHTRAVLNTLHRAAGELGMRPESNMYMDQSSSALVLASMLPLAAAPPTVDELKYNRAIADTFHFYALKNVYIPHNTVEGTFEVIEAAKHQLPFAGVWKMSKDLALVPHLVNREEVLECFRHACKGARCLAEQQFRTFLCNVARMGLSRPPHNVPIEDTMKELCRRYLVDGPQRMRRFGENVAPPPPSAGATARKGRKRRPLAGGIRHSKANPVTLPTSKKPVLVNAGRLRLLQPQKGGNRSRLADGRWPLHLLKPASKGTHDSGDGMRELNEKERRIMDMLDRNEEARVDRALHRGPP